MKILKNKELQSQVLKYIIISLLGYGYVFVSLYILVSIFEFNKTIAFLFVYGLLYLSLYLIQLKYLFKSKHSKKKFLKFISFLIVFYILANLLYNFFLSLKIDYLTSTVFTIIILTPLRFLVSKFLIYK